MKLQIVPLFCLCLSGTPNLLAQNTQLLDIELQNMTMVNAMKQIEDQTGFHILFNYKDLEPYTVSCSLNQASMEEVMNAILLNKPFTYLKVRKNTYIIKKGKANEPTNETKHTLSGMVKDSLSTPIEAAVVSVIDAKTGVSASQCITTDKGLFKLRTKGTVQLYISCMGYTPFLSDPFSIQNDTTLRIQLKSASIVLDNILVIGEKQTPAVRIINGNTVFFPRNSAVLSGSSALDALKKTPGIFVDGNDKISIGGRSEVLIILNGKPTYMKQEELVSMLKSMSASSIISIEVINNPSAQYDAEGSGGIININTQKQHTEGYSFSMNNGVSYWNNPRQNTELSFSLTQGKLSIMGHYHHQFGYYNLDYGMHRIQSGKDFYSPTKDTDQRKTIAGNLDFEYKLNDKNQIGGQLTANALFGPGKTATITEIRDAASHNLEQILYAQNLYYTQKGNRYGANLYYMLTPKEGTTYSIDANYAWFDGGSGNLQPNTYKHPNGETIHDFLYKSVNSRNIHIYALAYNQQHQIGSGKLKSGIKYAHVNAENKYRFFEIKENKDHIDVQLSNSFTYKEQLLAAYLLYTYHINEHLNMELGIRGEQTWSDGCLVTTDKAKNKKNKRSYFNIFPSVSFNYQISEEQSLSMGYGSRIDRPAYQDLNPFEYLLDELSYWKGNPFLSPQKTHRASLTFSHKQSSFSAAYTYMKDYKAQITDTLSINKVVMTPRNIGKQQQVSLTFNQGASPFSWWDMNLNIIGYYVNKDIAFDTKRRFKQDAFACIVTLMNTFRLPGKIQMELNGSYATRRLGASNEKMDPSGYVDLALGRSFLKKRLTVNLAFTDLFWTSNWNSRSSFNNFQLWSWGKGESRQIKLNIAYRFGKEKRRSHEQDFKEVDRL